jgi:hypothetical protein
MGKSVALPITLMLTPSLTLLVASAGQTPEIVPGEPGWNPALASDAEAAVSVCHVKFADIALPVQQFLQNMCATMVT